MSTIFEFQILIIMSCTNMNSYCRCLTFWFLQSTLNWYKRSKEWIWFKIHNLMLYKAEVADVDHNQNQNKIKRDKKRESIHWSIHISVSVQNCIRNQFMSHIYRIYHKVFFDHDQKAWQSYKLCCFEITARLQKSFLIDRVSEKLLKVY